MSATATGTEPGPRARAAALEHAVPHIRRGADGVSTLHLVVDGIHCMGCVRTIETMLAREAGVISARVNLSTRRLTLRLREGARPAHLLDLLSRHGFRATPYDPDKFAAPAGPERALLRAMVVAGFAAANVMLLSTSVWIGLGEDMGPATRGLMHWVSALIALPAVAYAVRPFLRSALGALRARRTNMDVPISVGVLLTSGMSLFETATGGPYVYFDSAVTLLFFLLVGRYLDVRARGRARTAAENLLSLDAATVNVMDERGFARALPIERVERGMTALVAAGERVPVDAVVLDGRSDVDTSLITGESVPRAAGAGDRVFAGTMNLTAPLRLSVAAVGEGTLLAEIARLMEAAEQARSRYVTLADRVARLYAPAVHGAALFTFLGWVAIAGAPWQQALLYAVAVLIVTCPCALGLAVPAVQVLACGRLLRRGILLKSATALERLAAVNTVVFDKTGTLTLGRPELIGASGIGEGELRAAASLAGASAHPLARALARAAPPTPVAAGVREEPGAGLALSTRAGEVRLGSRAWCGVAEDGGESGPELWLSRPGQAPARFSFVDRPRVDAAMVVAALGRSGLDVELVSGDHPGVVEATAVALGIEARRAAHRPTDKVARLAELAAQGRRALMVGDGLNDAPALSAAHVSMSPASAADISRTAADVVFQGERLNPVVEALATARRAAVLVRQNLGFALLYNMLAVPLAVMGLVTPLVAAAAMSSSSVLVMVNALRLRGGGRA